MADPEQTATRATLDQEWIENARRYDWMSAPSMPDYVNSLVSGKPLADGGHWALYAKSRFVEPLAARGTTLSMVSLGCGTAHIERSLITEFQWPIQRLLGLEYDAELRRAAISSFAELPIKSEFKFLDFNDPPRIDEQFDVVFSCHAIHHATDLEKFLPFVNRLLKPGGLFVGIEFFGPTRFQVEYETKAILDELYRILPPSLTRDLRNPLQPSPATLHYASIEEVRDADISESVRSSDLRTMVFANFPVVDIKPMGGTLLRWLLQYRAGNFDHQNDEHRSIARLLQFIERYFISSRLIRSDDMFFVLGKSSRL